LAPSQGAARTRPAQTLFSHRGYFTLSVSPPPCGDSTAFQLLKLATSSGANPCYDVWTLGPPSAHLSTYPPIHSPIYLFFHLSTHSFIYPFMHLSIYPPSTYPASTCPSTHPFIPSSILSYTSPPIYPPTCPSSHPSIRPPIHSLTHPSTTIHHLPIHLSISSPIHPSAPPSYESPLSFSIYLSSLT
jgi:hypothetical protein